MRWSTFRTSRRHGKVVRSLIDQLHGVQRDRRRRSLRMARYELRWWKAHEVAVAVLANKRRHFGWADAK